MCTSLTLPVSDGRQLFGRTLDLDAHFGERVILTPRRFPLTFRAAPAQSNHYALLGMASVTDGYPLYAEAMNEQGLYMAGLRFAGNAQYAEAPAEGMVNLAPWELIPYLLGQYATLPEVRKALETVRVVAQSFREDIPAAPLHWHIADRDPAHGSVVLEVTADGMHLYENPVGVMTNNPPFPYQLAYNAQFAHLTNRNQSNTPAMLGVDASSLGQGARGLPGDYTSQSRFVRAAYLRRMVGEAGVSLADGADVAMFFRMMDAVSPLAGVVLTSDGVSHRTLYTCCMDGAAGSYHYTMEADYTPRTVSFCDGSGHACEGTELQIF